MKLNDPFGGLEILRAITFDHSDATSHANLECPDRSRAGPEKP